MKTLKQSQNSLKFIGIQLILATVLVAGATIYIRNNYVGTQFMAGTEEKEVTFTYHPKDLTGAAGSSVSFIPFLRSKIHKPGYIQMKLTYNADILAFHSVDYSHVSDMFEVIVPAADSATGTDLHTITLTYGLKDKQILPHDSIELGTVLFTVLNETPTTIRLNKVQSQVIFTNAQEAEITSEEIRVNYASVPLSSDSAVPEMNVFPPEITAESVPNNPEEITGN